MQFECNEKHIFSGIVDYFRLFLSDTLTSLYIAVFKSDRKNQLELELQPTSVSVGVYPVLTL